MVIPVMAHAKADGEEVECYVGVLFTRERYGPPTAEEMGRVGGYEGFVVDATARAVGALLRGIRDGGGHGSLGAIEEIRMPRINAGLFGIPWEKTEEALNRIEEEDGVEIIMYDG